MMSENGDDDDSYLEEAYMEILMEKRESMDLDSLIVDSPEDEIQPSPIYTPNTMEPNPDYRVPLPTQWRMYFDEGFQQGESDYVSNMKKLGNIGNVNEFWSLWNDIHVRELPQYFNLRVFKKSVKPIAEDRHNTNGGKFVRLLVF
jgi:hypothetical protein